MSEILLLDANYLKRITQLNGQVHEDQMQSAIIAAQDIYLQPYLGSDLLDALKTKAQAGTLANEYLELVNTYVRKALAWLVVVDLLPSLYVQLRNGGIVINAPQGTLTTSPDDLHRLREDARNKAQFYLVQMCKFLSHHTAQIPEYGTNNDNRLTARKSRYTQGFQIATSSRPLPYYTDMYDTK